MLDESKDEVQHEEEKTNNENIETVDEEEIEEIEEQEQEDELTEEEIAAINIRKKGALYVLGLALVWLLSAIVFFVLEDKSGSIITKASSYVTSALFLATLLLSFFVYLGGSGAMMFSGLLQGLSAILNVIIMVVVLVNNPEEGGTSIGYYVPNFILFIFNVIATVSSILMFRELVGAKLLDVEVMMKYEKELEYEDMTEADAESLDDQISTIKKTAEESPENIRAKKLAEIFESAFNYGVTGKIEANENTMIAVDNLTKFYGPTKALDSVSFAIEKNEIIGFLGPNGAGKSTAMKILTTFIPSSAGTAWVAGFNIHDEPLEVRKRIGYLPETTPLYKQMKVVDYLKFSMKARNVPSERQSHNLYWVREACGLKPVWNMFINELSKGYRQRVGLAQSMIHEPEILILDEPSSGLDPNQIIEIRSLIKEIAKEKTVILSTHILQEVTAICSRVLVINQGKLVANGTIDELSRALSPQGQYIVRLNAASEKAIVEFQKLEGVHGVHVLFEAQNEPLTLIVVPKPEFDADKLAPHIVQTCTKNEWALIELKREQASLEDVFVSLTTSDDTAKQVEDETLVV